MTPFFRANVLVKRIFKSEVILPRMSGHTLLVHRPFKLYRA